MHYLINLIVTAENEAEANEQAHRLLDDLVECGDFDWYNDDPNSSRWPNCWKPISLTSEAGTSIVTEAMDYQLSEFKDSLTAIREMLSSYSDEQIFEEQFAAGASQHYLSRYEFTRAGGYHSGIGNLYGGGYGMIMNHSELRRVLESEELQWLVQADCHR